MVDFYREANGLEIQWDRRGQKELPDDGVAAGYIYCLSEKYLELGKILSISITMILSKLFHPLGFFY